MTDTDILYMASQEKRITDLENENRLLKQRLLKHGTGTHRCMKNTRNAMYLIAEEMLLRGEY